MDDFLRLLKELLPVWLILLLLAFGYLILLFKRVAPSTSLEGVIYGDYCDS